MHLVMSRVTWHEYVTLVALGRCALLYGNWYLTLITIVNAWFKCYDSLIEMYIAFKNVLDAKIYDCWIIWEKIYVYLILVYEYYKCKCNFTLAFLLLVILSNPLFCVYYWFEIRLSGCVFVVVRVCRCPSRQWSSALIVTRGNVHIMYIDSFISLYLNLFKDVSF
jgi:hypothetical protein